jgi:hypothetical protein
VTAARGRVVGLALLVLLTPVPADAHDGPPFPIVADRVAGNYRVSVWTDPDATDDGSAGGQFWVILEATADGAPVPAGTRVTVAVSPLDRAGPAMTAPASPTQEDPARQFGAVVLDHEGRFRVHVTLDGPLGPAAIESEVEATYDLRPPPIMLAVYALPFLMVGFLWLKLLLRRRRGGVVRTR